MPHGPGRTGSNTVDIGSRPRAGWPAVALGAGAVLAIGAAALAGGEPATVAVGLGSCDPLGGDAGCGHGAGCLCHLWSDPGPAV